MTVSQTAHCGAHARHVGYCAACQRASLAALREQLAQVEVITHERH